MKGKIEIFQVLTVLSAGAPPAMLGGSALQFCSMVSMERLKNAQVSHMGLGNGYTRHSDFCTRKKEK